MTSESEFDRATTSLSRRTVLRTAAWSAPVIAVAIAAPAAAASGGASPARLNIDTFGFYSFNSSGPYGTGTAIEAEVRNLPPGEAGSNVVVKTVFAVLTYPKSAFTGPLVVTVANPNGSTGTWVAGTPTTAADPDRWTVTITYTGDDLTPGGAKDSTPVMNINLATKLTQPYPQDPTPQNRSWPGATLTFSAYGVDEFGDFTPVVFPAPYATMSQPVSNFWV